MRKVVPTIVIIFVLVIGLVGGYVLMNSQMITKKFGGNTTVDLPPGKKLVPYTVQWEPKESNLWYLTEDAEEGYKPKKYEFYETSNMGFLEGSITFQEHGIK